MVFGLFSKKDKVSGGAGAKEIAKLVEQSTNKLAQTGDRLSAMQRLSDDGSQAALVGLCKRWSITSSKGVDDESEKVWVVDALVSHGAAVVPSLRLFMKSAEQLSFALRVLAQVTSSDVASNGKISKAQGLEIIDELLASEPPGYTRHPERRIDVISWLAEWKVCDSNDVVPRLAPYLVDFDENARFATIDGLAHHDAALISEPFAAALVRPEEESGRIRRTLAEHIASKGLSLGDHASAVAAVLTGPLSGLRVVDGRIVGSVS
jgi:hypothetical protein